MATDEEIYADFETKKKKRGFFSKIFRSKEEVLDERIQKEKAQYERQANIYQKQKELDEIRARKESVTPPSKVKNFIRTQVDELKRASDRGSYAPRSRTPARKIINVKNVQQVYGPGRQLPQNNFPTGNSFGSGLAIDRPTGSQGFGGFMIDAPSKPFTPKKDEYKSPFRRMI